MNNVFIRCDRQSHSAKEIVMSVPTQDDVLLSWSDNFSTRISATPLAFGLSASLASAYAGYQTAYASAKAAASVPGTRSQSLVSAKNASKKILLENSRFLYQIVQNTPTVTNSQRNDLGIHVRKEEPTPGPIPDAAPALIIKSVGGWTAKIQLRDANDSARRGKPIGVSGAAIFSFVGAEAPSDIGSWKFEGNTGKTRQTVQFDNTLAAGTKVWLTAMWFNGAKDAGPACAPVTFNLPGGSVEMTA
jgi:hypothetical protein